MNIRLGLGLCLSLAACGTGSHVGSPDAGDAAAGADGAAEPAHAEPFFADGDRLHAVYDQLGDDVQIFDRWHDTQLDVDCAFAPTQHGGYCFPPDARIVFKDSACTVPAMLVEDSAEDSAAGIPTHVTGFPADACSKDDPQVFRVAERLDDDGYHVCAEGSSSSEPVEDGYQLFELEELPLDRLVAASARPERGDERIAKWVWRADDGAQQATGGYDRDSDLLVRAVEDKWRPRAMATTSAFVTLYTDAACKDPVAYTSMPVCEVVSILFEGHDYAAIPWGTQDLYGMPAGEPCKVIAPFGGSDRFYALGDLIPDDTYAAAQMLRVGEGRVQAYFYATQDGTPIEPRARVLWDSKLGADCYVELASDGKRRCLPDSVGVRDYVYSSDTCGWGERRDVVYVDDAKSQNGYVTITREVDGETVFEPHELGGALANVYEWTGTACAPIKLEDKLYALGQEIAADEFVEAVRHE